MAEVLERSVAISGRSKHEGGAAGVAFHEELGERSRRRAASATWSPTLGPEDLACLMSVIESQLLPTLLRSYRPAKRKPLSGSSLA